MCLSILEEMLLIKQVLYYFFKLPFILSIGIAAYLSGDETNQIALFIMAWCFIWYLILAVKERSYSFFGYFYLSILYLIGALVVNVFLDDAPEKNEGSPPFDGEP